MKKKSAEYWIKKLKLKPHKEGGYYREIYRSEEKINSIALPERYNGERHFATSIYFLLKSGQPSKFHKLKSDEIWNYHYGSPIIIISIDNKGNLKENILGNNYNNNNEFQITIPKETLFAAYVTEDNSFSIVGCTSIPGFEYEDFELKDKNEITKQYPALKDTIIKFT
jgi:uncharacterized protein